MDKQIASEKIEDIYKALLDRADLESDGLLGGRVGLALFFFYYAKYQSDQDAYDKGYEIIESVIGNTVKYKQSNRFSDGLAGIGWSILHLANNDFIDIEGLSLFTNLNEVLYDAMMKEFSNGYYDYLHGALGIGIFFLEQKDRGSVYKYLESIVLELDRLSINDSGNTKWESRNTDNNLVVNISLSHGMASIIVLLSKLFERGILKEKTERLLIGAVNYLISQKLDSKQYNSLYPNLALESLTEVYSSRLAWCYGDLGIANALFFASKALDNEIWRSEALSIFYHSAQRRDLSQNLVYDAAFCHGASGIGHIFNRMYSETKDSDFLDAANYWFSKVIELASFKDGIAGFKSYAYRNEGSWRNEERLLEGVAGTGLALISKVSDIEPKWDSAFLLS